MKVELLNETYLNDIIELVADVNPDIHRDVLRRRQLEMFGYSSYCCFGLFWEGKLVGISSAWITTRFYSGKQLELDNVIVAPACRSMGFGEQLLAHIERWAAEQACLTVELNTYVVNNKSHKFYFNQGFNILGYHFQKKIID